MEQDPGAMAPIVVSVPYNPGDVVKIARGTHPLIRNLNAATSHTSISAGTPVFQFSDPVSGTKIVSAHVNGIPSNWKMEPIGAISRGSDPHTGTGNDDLTAVQVSGAISIQNDTSEPIQMGSIIGFSMPEAKPDSSELTTPNMVVLDPSSVQESVTAIRNKIVEHGNILDFQYLWDGPPGGLGNDLTNAILEKLHINRQFVLYLILGIRLGIVSPTLPSLAAVNNPAAYNGSFSEREIPDFTAELAEASNDPIKLLSETFFSRGGRLEKTMATHGVSGVDKYLQDCLRYLSHMFELLPKDDRLFKGSLSPSAVALLHPNSVSDERLAPVLDEFFNYSFSNNSSDGLGGAIKLLASPAGEESVAAEVQSTTARTCFGIAHSPAQPGGRFVIVLAK